MNTKKLSIKAAAKKLLAQTGEPMTPKEITALAMDEGLIKIIRQPWDAICISFV